MYLFSMPLIKLEMSRKPSCATTQENTQDLTLPIEKKTQETKEPIVPQCLILSAVRACTKAILVVRPGST